MERTIILASRSPRRKQLLEQIGLKFEVRESEYEEDMQAKDDPHELVKFLALEKARDVARHYEDAIIIGADTFIVFDNKFIGKPKNVREAKEMLKNFSGKEHVVITGLAIIDTKSNKIINDFGEAKVKFRNLSEKEIDTYIATGEAMKKAGAYNLLGKAAILIDSVSGDFYSIIGLPLNKVYLALREMGVNVFTIR